MNNSDLPSIIFKYHKLNQNTLNIKINSVKRIDKSRFGNAIVGNYKILIQFLKIFYLNQVEQTILIFTYQLIFFKNRKKFY